MSALAAHHQNDDDADDDEDEEEFFEPLDLTDRDRAAAALPSSTSHAVATQLPSTRSQPPALTPVNSSTAADALPVFAASPLDRNEAPILSHVSSATVDSHLEFSHSQSSHVASKSPSLQQHSPWQTLQLLDEHQQRQQTIEQKTPALIAHNLKLGNSSSSSDPRPPETSISSHTHTMLLTTDPLSIVALRSGQLPALSSGALSVASSPHSSLMPPAEDSSKLSESEVNERRRTFGILGKLARTFSLSAHSNHALNSQVRGQMKTKAKHCQPDLLENVVHTQTIAASTGPIWCVAVSHDGQFVATGGQDSIVRVWAVWGSLPARQIEQRAESNTKQQQPTEGIPLTTHSSPSSSVFHSKSDSPLGRFILHPTPFRLCSGHRADITCLSWSSSDDFLLSSSIDKTVCLWHVSSSRCIRVFPHTDLITCIAFHPREHRYFVSGSFDNRIRLWNILEARVVEWAQTAHFVTAVAFSPSGHMVVAGLHHGQCVFYLTAGLKYHTQLDCRNRSGKHAKGKKVTGLEYSRDGSLLLVTTNDSRVRCYRMRDFALHCKMKGVENESLQIRASFHEEQGQLVAIMGSDKDLCAVWKIPSHELAPALAPSNLQASLTAQREHSNSGSESSRSQSSFTAHYRANTPSVNGLSSSVPSSTLASSNHNHGQVLKVDAYECFKAIDDSPVTCALFLPQPSVAFSSAGESQQALPVRHIILAVGLHGEMKLFESRHKPPRQQH